MFSTLLISCDNEETPNVEDATKLSFKAASGYDYLKTINGQTVTISGYMATSSPVDGSFMFLMNLPYQSCPFCVPNTSQLSNTLEIYPRKGESFSYTAQAIQVVGTLMVSESEDKPFTDKYGYEFCCKIVDAVFLHHSKQYYGCDLGSARLWCVKAVYASDERLRAVNGRGPQYV